MNTPVKQPIRTLAFILAAVLVVLSLGGCAAAYLSEADGQITGATPGPVDSIPSLTTPSYYTTTPVLREETYTPEYQLQLLADRDFKDAVFLVIREEGLENAVFPDSDDLIQVYADRRNRLISEKYNVQLASIAMSADEIIEKLTRAKAYNDYFADLLIVSPSLLVTLQSKGLLQAMDSLPFFEAESACIRADATVEINSGWKGIYGIWGDALRQPAGSYAVYYNLDQAQEMGSPNFYGSVLAGSWDFATLLASAEEGKLVFDGSAADLLFSASGLTSLSEEGMALAEDPEYIGLLTDFEACRYLPEGESAKEAFLAGKTLFYIGKLGDLSELSAADVRVGLLPLPKYDKTDADYPYLADQSQLPIFACPVNVTNESGTAIMIAALNAASCDEVEEIFLQSAETHVRDNGSTLMLPYCIGTLSFDRKFIFE